MTDKELEILFNQYEKLESQIKSLTDHKDSLRAEIKTEMEKRQLEKLKMGRVTASRTTSTRISYPTKMLESVFTPEQLKPCQKITTVSSLKVLIAKE